MKRDTANIFRAFAVLSAFVAAVLVFSGFAYWAAGLAGVAALMIFVDFAHVFGLSDKSGKNEKR